MSMCLVKSNHSKEEDPQGNFCFVLKRHLVTWTRIVILQQQFQDGL